MKEWLNNPIQIICIIYFWNESHFRCSTTALLVLEFDDSPYLDRAESVTIQSAFVLVIELVITNGNFQFEMKKWKLKCAVDSQPRQLIFKYDAHQVI